MRFDWRIRVWNPQSQVINRLRWMRSNEGVHKIAIRIEFVWIAKNPGKYAWWDKINHASLNTAHSNRKGLMWILAVFTWQRAFALLPFARGSWQGVRERYDNWLSHEEQRKPERKTEIGDMQRFQTWLLYSGDSSLHSSPKLETRLHS